MDISIFRIIFWRDEEMATSLPSLRETNKYHEFEEEKENERTVHLNVYYSSLRGWEDGRLMYSYSFLGYGRWPLPFHV